MKIRVGTRGSNLALIQTNWAIDRLKEKFPEVEFEVKIIKTKGDKILHLSLDKIGDKGLFVKEIESQLLEGEIDLAVHSMKDMPAEVVEGLKFAAVPKREDPRDVIIEWLITKRTGSFGILSLPITFTLILTFFNDLAAIFFKNANFSSKVYLSGFFLNLFRCGIDEINPKICSIRNFI